MTGERKVRLDKERFCFEKATLSVSNFTRRIHFSPARNGVG
jgi:hypothetical protein